MAQLILEPTSTAQWHALVSEAEAVAERQLDETLESYLVFLLMRFASRPDLASRALAIDYLRGSAASGQTGGAGVSNDPSKRATDVSRSKSQGRCDRGVAG